METTQILNASLLDIVFEGRNKAYGAYDLRRTYDKRLSIALLATAGMLALFFAAFFLFKSKPVAVRSVTPSIVVNILPPPPTTRPKVVVPPPPKAVAPLKIKMQKFTVPVVTQDKDVTPQDMSLKQKDMDKITIGGFTQKGVDDPNRLGSAPIVRGVGGTDKDPLTKVPDYNHDIFYLVQVEASFPGGNEAWQRYLKSNLRENVPIDNGAPAGFYAVTVSFLVSRDGNISEVQAVSAPTPDYGTAAEAVRVIQRGPKWNPAIQNGRQVTYRQKQRIIFTVQND